MGLEGIVSKRRSSPYRSGRSPHWLKALINYARRIELVRDGSPRYLRHLVVEWGEVPTGCRLTLTPLSS